MRILKRPAIVAAAGLAMAAGVVSIAVVASAQDQSSTSPPANGADTSTADISTVMDEVNFLFELPGYSVSVADEATSTLNVYWKGEPPAEMAEARSIAEEHGVQLVVTPARYSEHELSQAAAQVLRTAHREGIPVTRVGFAQDGAGVIATSSTDLSPAAQQTLRQVTDVAILRFETSSEQTINFGGA